MKENATQKAEGKTGTVPAPEVARGAAENDKMNNATISQVRGPDKDDYRKAATRFTVYTDGKARNIADREYFTKHEIYKLNFKCASWARVGGFAAAIEASKAAEAIKAAFGVNVELKFSQKAGCSCGCSPGFVGKILSDNPFSARHGGTSLSRASVWMNVPITKEEEASIVACAVKWAAKLPAEIEAGNARVAAEKAAIEAARLAEQAECDARRARWAAQEREWEARRADASLVSADL